MYVYVCTYLHIVLKFDFFLVHVIALLCSRLSKTSIASNFKLLKYMLKQETCENNFEKNNFEKNYQKDQKFS